MLEQIETPSKEQVKRIERKLERCQFKVTLDNEDSDDDANGINNDDGNENDNVIDSGGETMDYESYSQQKSQQERMETKLIKRNRK